MLIRLRPALDISNFGGRFELELTNQTSLGKIFQFLRIMLKKTEGVIELRLGNLSLNSGENSNEPVGKYLSLENDNPPILEYCWVETIKSSVSTQTEELEETEKNVPFPPMGVSRFKYLRIRTSVIN